jgi:hypothetical protein
VLVVVQAQIDPVGAGRSLMRTVSGTFAAAVFIHALTLTGQR